MSDSDLRYDKGTAGAFLAENDQLPHDTIATRVDGKNVDLHTAITVDASIHPTLAGDPDALTVICHSTAHVPTDAVQRLYPVTKMTIGPFIVNGFYYDFDNEDGGAFYGRIKEFYEGGVSLKTRADGDLGFISIEEFVRFMEEKAASPEN